jgi:hypothetical protein
MTEGASRRTPIGASSQDDRLKVCEGGFAPKFAKHCRVRRIDLGLSQIESAPFMSAI